MVISPKLTSVARVPLVKPIINGHLIFLNVDLMILPRDSLIFLNSPSHLLTPPSSILPYPYPTNQMLTLASLIFFNSPSLLPPFSSLPHEWNVDLPALPMVKSEKTGRSYMCPFQTRFRPRVALWGFLEIFRLFGAFLGIVGDFNFVRKTSIPEHLKIELSGQCGL